MAIGAILGQTLNMLTSATATKLGLNPTANVDDAFNKLAASVLYETRQGKPSFVDVNGTSIQIPSNQIVGRIPSSQITGAVQIETGSYVGAGHDGYYNQNSLTFQREPKIVIVNCIQDDSSMSSIVGYFINNGIYDNRFYLNAISHTTKTSQSYGVETNSLFSKFCKDNTGNTVLYWYSDKSWYQLNWNGVTYYYTAIS